MRSFALVLVALAAATCASGQTAEPWTEVNSPHFSVVTDAGEKAGREVAVHFEQMREAFAQLLLAGGKMQSSPVRIIAFRHKHAMNDFGLRLDQRESHAQRIVDSGDVVEELDAVLEPATHRIYRIVGDQSVKEIYLHSEDQDYVLINLGDRSDWKTIRHEYAHRLLERNFAPLPRWFAEGVAEYYSTARIGKNKVMLGKLPKPTAAAARNNPWIPVAALFSAGEGGQEISDHGAFNLESCLVFDYLIRTNKLGQAYSYSQLYRQNTPVGDAIQRAFGMSSAELDRQVQSHGRQLASMSLAVEKPSEVFPVSPVAPLAVAAMLADVHLHEPGYHKTAVKELNGVLEKDPGNSAALRGLALDKYRKFDIDGAMDLLRQALKRNPDDWLAHYYRARIMRKRDDPFQVKELEKEAREVVRLNPDFAEGYGMLGSALASQGKNREAAAAFETARSLEPSDDVHAANLALVYLALDRRQEAREILVGLQNSKDLRFANLAQSYLKSGAAPEVKMPR
ncbi:MAG TPA: tetratricopeptide repeat protein [Candidatus Angelobacter sp.]|nr:tetratricopeptide repeat protein [Candidatus Angelobacter sp.]